MHEQSHPKIQPPIQSQSRARNRQWRTNEYRSLSALQSASVGGQLCCAEGNARWRSEFLERAPELFAVPEHVSQDQARIAELEQMVGKLTMKLEIAQKASAYLQTSKNKSW